MSIKGVYETKLIAKFHIHIQSFRMSSITIILKAKNHVHVYDVISFYEHGPKVNIIMFSCIQRSSIKGANLVAPNYAKLYLASFPINLSIP